MSTEDQISKRKRQLEAARGDSGGKGKTAVGADDAENLPELPFRPRAVSCDRNDLIRAGMRAMLEPTVIVVEEATDGQACWDIACRIRPHLVIADIDIDGINGLELCLKINENISKSTRVLIATDSFHATKCFHRLRRAASGIHLKSTGSKALLAAVANVMKGDFVCDASVEKILMQSPKNEAVQLLRGILSRGEVDVLLRLSEKDGDIAAELGIGISEVKILQETIFKKLNVLTRTRAALKAVTLGLEPLPRMPARDPDSGEMLEFLQAVEHAKNAIAEKE